MTALALLLLAAPAADFSPQINDVLAVGPAAENQDAARSAVKRLSMAGPDVLVPLLEAMGRADGVADNWLRGAYEAALDRTDSVPVDALGRFFADRAQDNRARRLAYETIRAADPAAAEVLAADGLDDPSPEMRKDAVAAIVAKATSDDAAATLRRALDAATDRTQVDDIAAKLKELGEEVDLKDKFGFLRDWRIVGPFDNRDEKGFDKKAGPEAGELAAPDFEAGYGSDYPDAAPPVSWGEYRTDSDDGVLDVAAQLQPWKGATVYAASEFEADAAREVELRLSTDNAWKLWLNGELLFEREEYHRSMSWDQYVIPARVREGRNVVVLKVLQNEQDQGWAQDFSYSLRVTDPAGRAVNFD